jgi:hypothetical protein
MHRGDRAAALTARPSHRTTANRVPSSSFTLPGTGEQWRKLSGSLANFLNTFTLCALQCGSHRRRQLRRSYVARPNVPGLGLDTAWTASQLYYSSPNAACTIPSFASPPPVCWQALQSDILSDKFEPSSTGRAGCRSCWWRITTCQWKAVIYRIIRHIKSSGE